MKEYLNKELSEEENIKMKMDLLNSLKYFAEKHPKDEEINVGKNTPKKAKSILDNLNKKDDRTISKDVFNVCMEWAGLPYRIEGKNGAPYLIIEK